MRNGAGRGLYFVCCILAGVWGLFFLGEAIEGVLRGESDVAGLVIVGVTIFWGYRPRRQIWACARMSLVFETAES